MNNIPEFLKPFLLGLSLYSAIAAGLFVGVFIGLKCPVLIIVPFLIGLCYLTGKAITGEY